MYLSTRNHKLQPTENRAFLIWNLPAVFTCPYSTNECRTNCYARKSERMYPSVLPCRKQNFADSLQADFVLRMAKEIERYLDKPSFKGKQVFFRIHESGDFYSEEYTKKWLKIAWLFPDVTFLAYTKSLDFFIGKTLPNNFVLRASIWGDTQAEELEKIITNDFNTFTALPEKELKRVDIEQCNCSGGCAECGKCYTNDYKHIAIAIH